VSSGHDLFELLAQPLVPVWIAVIITALGLFYAIKLFVQTRRQADAAHNANRSWILIEEISAPDMFAETNFKVSGEIATLLFVFKLKVYGGTPARIIKSRVRFRIVPGRRRGGFKEPDLPIPPDYGQPLTHTDSPELTKTLAPGEIFSGWAPLEDQLGLVSGNDLSFWADVQKQDKFICTYGSITYQDAFDGAPIRETKFCYVYRRSVGAIWVDAKTGKPLLEDGFRVGGPPGYNEAT
jgi:hypothetical protein